MIYLIAAYFFSESDLVYHILQKIYILFLIEYNKIKAGFFSRPFK